ncbi:MAG: hypothetical protein RR578_01300 [Bacilli bacterium]
MSDLKNDRIRKNNKNYKNVLKAKKKHIILSYEAQNENKILDELLEYTCQFIVLYSEENYINLCQVTKLHSYNCDDKNYKTTIKEIFDNNSRFSDVDNINVDNIVNVNQNYIFFILFEEYPHGFFEAESIFSYLLNQTSNITLFNILLHDGHVILKYKYNVTEKPPIVDNIRLFTSNTIILNPMTGIGDYFMQSSVLTEFVDIVKQNNITLYFIVVDVYKNNDENLIDMFFPDVKKIIFPNYVALDVFLNYHVFQCPNKQNNLQIINFKVYFPYDDTNYHILYEIVDILNTFLESEGLSGRIKSINPFKHQQEAVNTFNKIIKKQPYMDEIKYIDQLFLNKEYIGLQYYTGSFNELSDQWIQADTLPENIRRSLTYNQVKTLVNLCKDNDIEILLLNQNPYNQILETTQLQKVSLYGYIYAISKLKLHIGIDSSAGHIASFFNLPTITIWGYQTSIKSLEYTRSFRILRKNFSINSKSKDIKMILPETIIQILLDIINGNIVLDERIISIDDIINGYMTKFVD